MEGRMHVRPISDPRNRRLPEFRRCGPEPGLDPSHLPATV